MWWRGLISYVLTLILIMNMVNKPSKACGYIGLGDSKGCVVRTILMDEIKESS